MLTALKGKVTLFNVGSSFSYETGINGSRRCALYPPASVSAPFNGYSKLWLHGSEESRWVCMKSLGLHEDPLCSNLLNCFLQCCQPRVFSFKYPDSQLCIHPLPSNHLTMHIRIKAFTLKPSLITIFLATDKLQN